MTQRTASHRDSQSTRSSRGWWFWTVYLAMFAGAALIAVLAGHGAVSETSRPPVSAYLDNGVGPNVLAGVVLAVLVTSVVWLAVRTATGRTLSRTATVMVLAASFLLVQAAMAGVSELGRRQAEADVRAQADACSVADVDLLREVYSTLGSKWGPFAAHGMTDGSCHGPEVETNDPADEGTWVVAQMTDDGWALVQSSPRLLVFDRETDQVHVSIARFETPPPVEPDDPEVLIFYDFWVEP